MNRVRGKQLLIVAASLYVIASGFYGLWAHRKLNQWSQERAERIAASPKVHITAEGEKYHNARHYRNRSQQVSLYEAKEMRLDPCKICYRQHAAFGDNVLLLSLPPWYQRHWIILLAMLTVCGVVAALFVNPNLRPHVLTWSKLVPAMIFLIAWFIFLGWLIPFLVRQFGRGLDWIGPAATWAIVGTVLSLLVWFRFFARRVF